MPIFYPASQMPQGSEAWRNARLGIPTASAFDRIITPAGKLSASRDTYMNELLAERMTGYPVQSVTTKMMERGHEMEPDAVAYYEMMRECQTYPIGFVTNNAGTIGASPDRLVTPSLGVEAKAPGAATHVGYMRGGVGASMAYKIQTQGQIYVCDFDAVDIISYHPDMPDTIYRTGRDEPFIKLMAAALGAFNEELYREVERFRAEGWIVDKPKEKPVPAEDWLGVTDEDVTAIMEASKR